MKLMLRLLVILSFFFVFTLNAQEDTSTIPKDEIEDELTTFGPGMEDGSVESQKIQEKAKDVVEEQQPGTLGGVSTNELYIIVTGDNLWDICSQFLGNAFEWPRLWSINQYITNPHYIYPGDKIVFQPGSETQVPKMRISKKNESNKPEKVVEKKAKKKKKKVAAVEEEDKIYKLKLKNLNFITKKKLKESGKITHSGLAKKMLVRGDGVYLKFKEPDKIKVGDQFSVFDVVQEVRHPHKGKFLGYQIYLKGTVEVTSIEKHVIAGVIMDNTMAIEREDMVIPKKEVVKKLTPKNVEKDIDGYIVGAEISRGLIGQQEFVFVDIGKNRGIDEGDLLYVVRRGDGLFPEDDKKLPYVIVGKLMVVEIDEKTSTVFVLDSNQALAVGDLVKTRL